MKKLINQADHVVTEMLEGLETVYPGLRQLPGQKVMVRSDLFGAAPNTVAVISGGGSGHEPAHAGYVGKGMLSAAVAGEVFASPTPYQVQSAIHATAGVPNAGPGALLIIKNYTGDRMNFGMAAELAIQEGISVEQVVVADDVALAGVDDHAGRRGLAGTILVEKIAGAAADAGLPLSDVAGEARAAATEVWTMGVALSGCTVPKLGRPGFLLGPDEIELGLGIHGEPGAERSTIESAEMLVNRLLAAILVDARLQSGARIVVMINNLGGSTTMELAIIARSAIQGLESQGMVVERVYMGSFLTALDMAGVSLTVMRVDDNRLARLDAPTTAPAWPNAAWMPRSPLREFPTLLDPPVRDPALSAGRAPVTDRDHAFQHAVLSVLQAVPDAETELNDLDQHVGDGDLGTSLTRGALAALAKSQDIDWTNPAAALHQLGITMQTAIGGTSGPLYGILLLRMSGRLRSGDVADPKVWADAFLVGCEGVGELGGSEEGDRTMLDALFPAARTFQNALAAGIHASAAFRQAATAADAGAKESAQLKPRRGRSSYLGDRVLGIPDPGAKAVAIWLNTLMQTLESAASPE